MFLVYGGDKELVVNGYVDASFDTDPDDSKSQTGYVFFIEWWSCQLVQFQAEHRGGIYV